MARSQNSIGKGSVCGAVLFFASCSDSLTPRYYDPGVVHEETGAFPVGEIGSFSGPHGADALAFHRGFARAVAECNEKGGAQGRRMELAVLDDRGRPDDTQAGVRRLAGPNGAVAIGCSSDGECLKAARAVAGVLPILPGEGAGTPEQRGYAAGQRLVAACERVKKILPEELGPELAGASADTYPRAR